MFHAADIQEKTTDIQEKTTDIQEKTTLTCGVVFCGVSSLLSNEILIGIMNMSQLKLCRKLD